MGWVSEMGNIAGLRHRLDRMIEQVDRRRKPQTWVLALEAGQKIPAHILAIAEPFDTFVIRQYPTGYLGGI